MKGYQNDVDGNVYDQIFSTDDGKLALQADLDLNDHSIIGLAPPPKRQHIITGIYNKSLDKNYVLFDGYKTYIPIISLKIIKWSIYVYDRKSSHNQITLSFSMSKDNDRWIMSTSRLYSPFQAGDFFVEIPAQKSVFPILTGNRTSVYVDIHSLNVKLPAFNHARITLLAEEV